jgi:hypothetical protein
MSGTQTETTVFKIQNQTEFHSPTYSCDHLASGERSSRLNSQPSCLANQLKILSHRKPKDECSEPHVQDKQESSPIPSPFVVSLATANHPMIALLEREVLEGEVPHSNNLETSLGRLTFVVLIGSDILYKNLSVINKLSCRS